jgi:hypothetical protein
MQIRNDRLKTAVVDIYHLLQRRKRLELPAKRICVFRASRNNSHCFSTHHFTLQSL